jgi:hypothetical protein
MLPETRVFYIASTGLTAYLRRRGELRKEATFTPGEEGIARFAEYVAGNPRSLCYVLADVVEEDFFQENIPYLHGGDRRVLLTRKLAQRYRDTSLALALSLGTETTGRREERILYSSFTNTQQFQSWLSVLRAAQARIAGVYSVSLLTPLVGRLMRSKSQRYMLVSVQQAGLRQSYVENGRIRFSRLGRMELGDPRSLAEASAAESLRFYQYLANSRMLPREESPLEVMVLAPSKYRPLYVEACASTAQLRFQVLDLEDVERRAGLRSAPTGTLAEGLFLYLLGRKYFPAQFADDALRRFYDLWRIQLGLATAGAAVLVVCLLISGMKLFDISRIDRLADADRREEADASRQYAGMQANFPKTPMPADVLKATAKNYRAVVQQEGSLQDMLVEISQALALTPQIDVERIEWGIGSGKRTGAREASKAAAPSTGAAAEPRVQTVEISGRLLVQQASDYRNISMVVDQFVDALRARPGFEVVATRLPFDINAEKSISGDIGAARSADVPRFSVTVSRRLGT